MICYFCAKGRHKECMIELPVRATFEGTSDCSFDVKHLPCGCNH